MSQQLTADNKNGAAGSINESLTASAPTAQDSQAAQSSGSGLADAQKQQFASPTSNSQSSAARDKAHGDSAVVTGAGHQKSGSRANRLGMNAQQRPGLVENFSKTSSSNVARVLSQRAGGMAAHQKQADKGALAGSQVPTASRSGVVSTQATATSNYTSHGAQVTSSNTAMSAAPHGPGGPKSATRTAKKDEAGGTINKEVRMKRAGDGDKEKKRYVRGDKDKEEKEEEVEPWWPPFEFDGRQALKSKLTINLRNCQYELFRTIAAKELGWRVVDNQKRDADAVRKAKRDAPAQKSSTKETAADANDCTSNRSGGGAQSDDDVASPSKPEKEVATFAAAKDSDIKYGGSRLPMGGGARTRLEQDASQVPGQAVVPPAPHWDIFWADAGMTPEFLSSLSNSQRANHYLGMYNICRKSTLGMHLKRFKKEFPEHYGFFPQTWVYPAEFHDIQEYTKRKQEKRRQKIEEGAMTEQQSEAEPPVLFICKPESGSQGRGIFIAQKVEDMRISLNKTYEKNRENMNEYLKAEQGIETLQIYSQQTTEKKQEAVQARSMARPENQYIVQKYIRKPALHNGHKYDFRIYVLITSVISPMTIYLYNDGLVRLASERYDPGGNLDDPFVHLTNYSLNKNSSTFDSGKHKLRLKDVLRGELVSESNGKIFRKRADRIWDEIEQIVVKTMFVVQPQLAHLYRTSQAKEPDLCCDLLGFDVMLDHKLKPWILEVNHMPSFRADTKMDHEVKHDLIKNTLQILQLSIEQRRQMDVVLKQEQKIAMQYGNVRRMTVKEHSERVRFDHNLVDQYIPNNRFRRIFPLEPGSGGMSETGEELEEVYAKLEKMSNTIWKKSVGMVSKKDVNPNVHPEQKKKKKKNKKNLLTSMTSHVKPKDADPEQDQEQDDDQEEGPEDGEEEGEDGAGNLDNQRYSKRRDSNTSLGGDPRRNGDQNSSDLGHLLRNNRPSFSRRGANLGNQGMGKGSQNQSQSSLSQKNGSGPAGMQQSATYSRGMSLPRGSTNLRQQCSFVPLSEFGMQGLPTGGSSGGGYHQGLHPHLLTSQTLQGQLIQQGPYAGYGTSSNGQVRAQMSQKTKQEMLQSKSIQEELKSLQNYHPIPTLNEILTQLHQDPGFRQRYKEYCRAVLDGRFSFGGIKNPIYDHVYAGIAQHGQARPQLRDAQQLQQMNKVQFASQQRQPSSNNMARLEQQPVNRESHLNPSAIQLNQLVHQGQRISGPGPKGVTLLGNNFRQQQASLWQHSGNGVQQPTLQTANQASQQYLNYTNGQVPMTTQNVQVAGGKRNGKMDFASQSMGPTGVSPHANPQQANMSLSGLLSQTTAVNTQQRPVGVAQATNSLSNSKKNITEAAYFIQRVNKILQNQQSQDPQFVDGSSKKHHLLINPQGQQQQQPQQHSNQKGDGSRGGTTLTSQHKTPSSVKVSINASQNGQSQNRTLAQSQHPTTLTSAVARKVNIAQGSNMTLPQTTAAKEKYLHSKTYNHTQPYSHLLAGPSGTESVHNLVGARHSNANGSGIPNINGNLLHSNPVHTQKAKANGLINTGGHRSSDRMNSQSIGSGLNRKPLISATSANHHTNNNNINILASKEQKSQHAKYQMMSSNGVREYAQSVVTSSLKQQTRM